MKIGVVIQARLGSTRLPNKIFLELPNGGSVLGNIIAKVMRTGLPWIVTTPDVEVVRAVMGPFNLYKGERNVHAEIVQSAEKMNFEHIVRITADCPLLTTEDILHAVRSYRGHYIYHGPDGRDVEIFPLNEFKQLAPDNDAPTAGFHHNGLSLDTIEDFRKICGILKQTTSPE